MKNRNLKAALGENRPLIGSWITLASCSVAEIMANAGFDWLAVDLEHSVLTIRDAEDLIRIIDLCGVDPLVRLTSNNSDQIKRVMDAGAKGIIVPMVNSAEDARKAVGSLKYPPEGRRGVGLARAQKYGAGFENYYNWLKQESVVIVQIEHIDAVKNFKEIMSVEGVDGFIVGPYDLSGSMGIPGEFDRQEFKAAMSDIKQMASDMQKNGGMHIIEPEPDSLKAALNDGHTFVAYSLDIRMIDVACRTVMAKSNRG